jgi:hypothetical protein
VAYADRQKLLISSCHCDIKKKADGAVSAIGFEFGK